MEGKSMEGKESAPRMVRMISEGDSQKKSLHAASSASSMESPRNLRFSHDLQKVPIERHRQSLNLVRAPYDDRRLSRDVTMSVPYDEIKKTVNDAIYGNDVTVFIRNTCPFCTGDYYLHHTAVNNILYLHQLISFLFYVLYFMFCIVCGV